MLKSGIKVIDRKGLCYIVDNDGRPVKHKPWLGDLFSFLYDYFMKRSIFPKKFGADIGKHEKIMEEVLGGIHGKRVLELAAGGGSAAGFLPRDNEYAGIDISPGLLKRAAGKFRTAGFTHADFYIGSADDLPFDDGQFDIVICLLSMNFFDDVHRVLQEIRRVSAAGAHFICAVPVPERKTSQSPIRGTLYAEADWKTMCEDHGFSFVTISAENGALLYFRAA
jgi:ubiquinone/menaquinone biosynthesis C-methylase UbiE